MNSQRCREPGIGVLLLRYEFGALDEVERRRFEQHLMDCDHCLGELDRGIPVTAELREHATRYLSVLTLSPAPTRRRLRLPAWIRFAGRIASRPRFAVPAVALALALIAGQNLWSNYRVRNLATFTFDLRTASIVRGGGANAAATELLQAGMAWLERGRYREAERRFRAVRALDPGDPLAAYLLGLTLAMAGNAEDGIPPLEDAVARGGEPLREDALWTLANAYLKSGRLDEARRSLGELARQPGEAGRRAAVLLRKLDHSPEERPGAR